MSFEFDNNDDVDAEVKQEEFSEPEKINPKPRATIGTSFQLLRIPDLSG